MLSVMSILAMTACASGDETEDADGGEPSAVAKGLSPAPCTKVKLTTPTQNFNGVMGVPIVFTPAATCPAEQTPEYQYWQRLYSARTWTHLGAYVPGAWSWAPPSPDAWCVTVVVRATGAPENDQARANAKCGMIVASNQPPTAIADTISTTPNAVGVVNVLSNDSDSDGNAIAVTSFTQPAHGISNVSIAGVARYLPDLNYAGPDSFTYTITDPFGAAATTTVTVTVAGAP